MSGTCSVGLTCYGSVTHLGGSLQEATSEHLLALCSHRYLAPGTIVGPDCQVWVPWPAPRALAGDYLIEHSSQPDTPGKESPKATPSTSEHFKMRDKVRAGSMLLRATGTKVSVPSMVLVSLSPPGTAQVCDPMGGWDIEGGLQRFTYLSLTSLENLPQLPGTQDPPQLKVVNHCPLLSLRIHK